LLDHRSTLTLPTDITQTDVGAATPEYWAALMQRQPFGTAVPLGSIINWQVGTTAIANGIAPKSCQGASCSSDITIQVDSFDGTTHGSANLVADVMGYYH
jgi:hypothetical protein